MQPQPALLDHPAAPASGAARVGDAAHELNNLLTITSGYLEALEKEPDWATRPRVARALAAIRAATERGAVLIRGLLAASPGLQTTTEACEGAGSTSVRSAAADPRWRGQEKILIVDDRVDVAELARSTLDDYGYRTLLASNGPEALQRVTENPDLDLVFSDIIMPGGMNGVTLAREIVRRLPRVRVLLTTGYSNSSLGRSNLRRPEFEMLLKPYSQSDLAQKMREVLDGPVVGASG